MRRARTNQRKGFTLLELVVASGMMAALMTSGVVLLRTTQSVWEAHQEDHERLEASQKLVRHLVRRIRQSESVVAISDASDTTGSITLLMPDGNNYIWSLTGTSVKYGVDTATSFLARNVDALWFVAYEADGTTTTTDPAKIQSIECFTTITLPRGNGLTRTIRGRAWRRTW